MAKPLLSFKPTEFHKISDFGRDEVRQRYPDRISFNASTGEGAFPDLHPAVHKSGRTIPLDITFTLDEPRDLLLTVDLKTTRGLLEEFRHRLEVNGRFAFENKIPTVCFQSMQPAGGAAPYSYSALIDADFLRQGANTLTFTCESVPAGMPYEWTVYREITLQTTEEELEILGAEATVFFARAGDGLKQRVDVEFLSTVPHDELVPFGDLKEVGIEAAGYCTKEDVTIHRG
ncbi:MAG: hypothetical protein QF662_02595, partial [Phycisphaerae bacterium]|nr:hypothetical protein [Phycisphaerae bacterium]